LPADHVDRRVSKRSKVADRTDRLEGAARHRIGDDGDAGGRPADHEHVPAADRQLEDRAERRDRGRAKRACWRAGRRIERFQLEIQIARDHAAAGDHDIPEELPGGRREGAFAARAKAADELPAARTELCNEQAAHVQVLVELRPADVNISAAQRDRGAEPRFSQDGEAVSIETGIEISRVRYFRNVNVRAAIAEDVSLADHVDPRVGPGRIDGDLVSRDLEAQRERRLSAHAEGRVERHRVVRLDVVPRDDDVAALLALAGDDDAPLRVGGGHGREVGRVGDGDRRERE
jgi:hypothetical protein